MRPLLRPAAQCYRSYKKTYAKSPDILFGLFCWYAAWGEYQMAKNRIEMRIEHQYRFTVPTGFGANCAFTSLMEQDICFAAVGNKKPPGDDVMC